jgi:hypothetical protein
VTKTPEAGGRRIGQTKGAPQGQVCVREGTGNLVIFLRPRRILTPSWNSAVEVRPHTEGLAFDVSPSKGWRFEICNVQLDWDPWSNSGKRGVRRQLWKMGVEVIFGGV